MPRGPELVTYLGLAALLSACGQLFGLLEVPVSDAGGGGADDGGGVTGDAAACTPPMLHTWSTVSPSGFDFPGFIAHPSVTPTRVLFADYSGRLFDTPYSGGSGANQITSLAVTNEGFDSPSVSADGQTLYYSSHSTIDKSWLGLRKATRTGGWSPAPAPQLQLGFSYSYLAASAPASYGGQWRMVVAVQQPTLGAQRLVELVSTDQVLWTEVTPPTLGWSTGTRRDEEPYLSPDGCFVVFASSQRDASNLDLWYAVRTPTGGFDYPVALPYAMSSDDDRGPTMPPDGSALWFVTNAASQSVSSVTP